MILPATMSRESPPPPPYTPTILDPPPYVPPALEVTPQSITSCPANPTENNDFTCNNSPSALSPFVSSGEHPDDPHDSASASSSNRSRKSRWRRLKQENDSRRSKSHTITAEQATRISGRDQRGFLTPEGQIREEQAEQERLLTKDYFEPDDYCNIM